MPIDVTRRCLLQTGVGAGAMGLLGARTALAAVAPADLSGVTVRIAFYKGAHKTLLEAAGLAATPYKIEWKEFNSGVAHLEGINVDALDVGSGSETAASFSVRSNARVRFIAVYREDLNNQGTFVQRNSPIKTVGDLKGKRVGYVRGTTSHYYLYKQLAEVGLSFNDIDAKHLAPTDGLSAFSRGDLDAWAIWGYNGQLARTKYGAGTLKTGVGYLSGNFLIFANPKAIADPLRHAAIEDYLQRLKNSYIWAAANPLAYATAQARDTAVPVDALQELYNNRSQDSRLIATSDEAIASHQDVADVFTKIGVFDAPLNVAPFWDRSFDQALA